MIRDGRMSIYRSVLGLVLLVLNAGALAEFDRSGIVRLATTTSTENSGLLDELLPRFEEASGYRVHVIAVGTGKALRMGRDGDVDLVLVHAPAAEQRFVDQGFGELLFEAFEVGLGLGRRLLAELGPLIVQERAFTVEAGRSDPRGGLVSRGRTGDGQGLADGGRDGRLYADRPRHLAGVP